MNIKELCRLCLKTSDFLTDLFSNDSESKLLLEKIKKCSQITIYEKPSLPRGICRICIVELNSAYTFRDKCLTFEARYAVLINESKPQINESHFDEDSNNLEQCTPPENLTNKEMDIGCCITVNNIYQCDLCNKVLKTKISLKKHILSMHEKRKHLIVTGTGGNRLYHCSKCPYSTPHSQTLVNHMRRHNGERPYQCKCGKSFTQSSTLIKHQKIHTEDKAFICSTCGRQFKHAYTLKYHEKVHESSTFVCNICQKSLKSQKSLREHVYRHLNIRNFNCEECGDTFVSCSDLINHRKKHDHSNIKRLDCHLCEYKTNVKGNLVLHLKRHSGDKVFKCSLCNIAVYTRSELQRHRRVHTNEKPFACQMCGQRFSHSPSLNKHMSNVHGIQYKWQQIKKSNSKSISKS